MRTSIYILVITLAKLGLILAAPVNLDAGHVNTVIKERGFVEDQLLADKYLQFVLNLHWPGLSHTRPKILIVAFGPQILQVLQPGMKLKADVVASPHCLNWGRSIGDVAW